ncbi:MAG: Acyltransferase family protein [Methanocella sp. PtaU1.Bin125]|nr:MAG: Acyltransferase family protein [Methanocella sp. PtaU1.Bin125]
MEKINRYSNNFDFLRLIGAILVIFYTSFGVQGLGAQDPLLQLTNGVFHTGSLGVAIFFIISGYLITKSWDKRRNILRFAWARFLRLVPALAGVALITVFIIGPLTTRQGLWDYLTSGMTWGYFSIVSVFFPAYQLPGVFADHFTDRVNGALWTLPIESTMYLIVLIAGAAGILNKKHLATFLTISVLGLYLYINIPVVNIMVPIASQNFIYMLQYYINSLAPFYPLCFLMGSVFYLNRDKIKFDFRIVLLAVLAWVLSMQIPELMLLSSLICLPYIVLGTAFASIPFINRIGKRGDISYGLYIYHYPVQQTLLSFAGLDPLKLFIATFIIAGPLAWLSWHLVERRALDMKDIDLKRYYSGIQAPVAGAVRALKGYRSRIAVRPVANQLKMSRAGGATGLLKIIPGLQNFSRYIYEMRAAIIVIGLLYVIFSAAGFTSGVSYQNTSYAASISLIESPASIGDFSSASLAIGIFANNVFYCFMAMALGVFLGVIPVVFIMANGLTLGWFAGLTLPKTCFCYIMAGSIPHGLFEIPAVLLSSAIGLRLGYSLVLSLAGKKGFVKEAIKGVRTFVFWILPIIAVAAAVEALVTFPLLASISGGL